jgi:hypothetical protein
MLKALAEWETSPAVLAAMADRKLRATQAQLCDALDACTNLKSIYRRLLKMFLEELQLIDQQINQLDRGRSQRSDISFGQAALFLGGSVSWRRKELWGFKEPPLPER